MVYLEGRSAVGVVMLLYMFSVVISAPSGTKEWTVTALKHSKQYEMLRSVRESVRERRQATSTKDKNDVQLFQVETKIAVRFASTTITSRINNKGSSPQPLDFIMQLPLSAYIASFSLEVDGITYYGKVRDKCEGEDENTFDASGGLSSGRITALDPTRNTFMVSINVAPDDRVGVVVNYQELLERSQGWYTQKISINPQQVVREFTINAYITEPQGISKVEAGIIKITGDGSGGGSFSSSSGRDSLTSSYISLEDYISKTGNSRATMEFSPSKREQQSLGSQASGINGDFILKYDVKHDLNVGDVQTFGDIFVHHFSPSGLSPIRKTVAFVIDVSGSMFGQKLRQTKEALATIMDQMRPNDRFNIIPFSDEVYFWREDEMVEALSPNINKAKRYINQLESKAGTNLNDAMMEGLDQLRLAGAMDPISASNPGICILFVMTDGVPSKGVTNPRTIERNIQDSNQGKCSVVTLGFGADVDFNFLARIALENSGVARKIFEHDEASTQLIGVYDEVATPLLVNVAIEYLGNVVDGDSLTKTVFQNYFEGSEFAISGRLANLLAANLPIRITAISATGEITIEEYVPIAETKPPILSNSEYVPDDFAERTAAFISLAQLFNQYTVADPFEQGPIIDKSLELSEKYNLLTPLMSMTFVDSPPTLGGSSNGGAGDDIQGAVTIPPGLQWGISGSVYGQRGQSESTFGIGGSVCTDRNTKDKNDNVMIDLQQLHIESIITDRYARTTVNGQVTNKAEDRQDIPFTLQIPPGAFISAFSVELNGKTYTGKVADIRNPDWQLAFASSTNGRPIALVTKRDPTKDTFTMRVLGVAPESTVTFDLTYDELLERRRGVFEHRVNLWPGQVVDNLVMDIYITEPQGIAQMALNYYPRTSESDGEDLENSIRRSSDYRAHMQFSPTPDEQLQYTTKGVAGDIVLEYDVMHTREGSYTEVQDGYFVHFFSPTTLQHAAKHVVFVIDVSGSMAGTKLRQVKEALKIIIDDLGPKDRFNILVFSDNVQYWRPNALVQATSRNIDDAKIFIDGLIDQGETNLCEAILQADNLLDLKSGSLGEDQNILSMMYVLTDGQPTIGVRDPDELIRTVNTAINGKHALFALGFGRNVSFDLLVQLGLQNRGYTRKIHETADASQQLQRFYFEVSRPVIFDVEMVYESGVSNPDDLTLWRFPYYFDGSEVSVAGKLYENPSTYTLEGSVHGQTATGELYRNTRKDIRIATPELTQQHTVPKVTEHIWAMKTIQDLINQYAITDNPAARRALADRIALLATSYGFVTPLTPMLLTDPINNLPVIDDSLSPPTILHTGTNMDILRSLLQDLPGKPSIPGVDSSPDIFSVATTSSDGIEIKSLNMDSDIVLRFATTTISSTLENTGSQAGWAVFRQKIPLPAYITNFTLTVDGKTYYGVADEKSQNITLHRGNLEISQGGAFITELDPQSKVFVMSVNLKPANTADFSLVYQILLPRRRGMFKQHLGLYPGQIVDDMNIAVSITEPQGVRATNAFLMDRSLPNNPAQYPHLMKRINDHKRQLAYQPTALEQRQLSPDGIMGDFVVEYDVNHGIDAGDIQVLNNYFVQFFSPSGLAVLRKHVIFVIDTSSSMEGTKLTQVKGALNTILDEITIGDKFNILPFSNQVEFLDRYRMVEASKANIEYAKTYVDDLQEVDATNLNRAILEGVNMLRREGEKLRGEERVISMIIVLTDGEPTYGETDTEEIERNVEDAINGDYSLFCLAFGEDADFEFLNRLALNNHGVARRIPERADASMLLEGFYEEVATPLLYDVQFYYSEGVVPNTLSERFFPNYFNGSEIVVVGKLDETRLSSHVLRSFVYGKTASEEISLATDTNTAISSSVLMSPSIPGDLIERIWAYVMIQTLQRKRDLTVNPTPGLQRDITDTALQYAYLNPYTRMTLGEQLGSVRGPAAMRVWDRQLPAEIRDSLSLALSPFPTSTPPEKPVGNGGGDDSTGVDGDPHFVVNVPKSNVSLCFDINGHADDVFSLVKDKRRGLFINGKIIAKSSPKSKQKERTYIGEIGGIYSPPKSTGVYEMWFTPSTITVNINHRIQWGRKTTLQLGPLHIAVDGRQATVTLGEGIGFTVVRHKMPPSNKEKPSFMGFFMNDGSGLSDGAQGLIGQFQHTKVHVSTTDRVPGVNNSQPHDGQSGELVIRGRHIKVRGGSRNNDVRKKRVSCWMASHDSADGIIKGHYTDYLLSDLFGTM
ncbi:uncharacterized protein LOC117306366 isoform X1 [Asterias rubens]|uniref:uncharacterized protein LOC117306366 isoform X1 n=2 Tax=Asterias rubens TaxID=7604 RepID=UPI001455A1E2|nr:uncharacterized protein LOC117306366 isoform X1 [Asterias rubens]